MSTITSKKSTGLPNSPAKQPQTSQTDIDFSLNLDDITQFAVTVPNNEFASVEENMPGKGTESADTVTQSANNTNAKVKAKKSATAAAANPTSASALSQASAHQPTLPSSSTTTAKKNERKTNFKLKPLPYKITSVPAGLPVVEYKISPGNVVCFNGSNHFLSSFFKAAFEMNGIRYHSVEHYYQATKLYALCGYEAAANIQHVREPFKAKSIAKELISQHRVSSRIVEGWKRTDGLVTLIYAVALKFIQNQDLRKQLLDTNDALLVQTHNGDKYFAAGMNTEDFLVWVNKHANETIKAPHAINEHSLKHFPIIGNGQNILGFINMKVRHHLATATPAELHEKEAVNRILVTLAT